MSHGKRRFSSVSTDLIGREVLGRYHIVRKIASGGMGVVYLARYTGAHDFAKPVVVKIILPGYAGDEQFLGMFVREAKILASLHHPGIVEVIDFGEQDDFYVMVLEYVHGFQLREWALYREHIGKVFSIDVILQLVIDVLEALHHAHTLKTPDGVGRKVIHRDISPSNVMLSSEGRIKLVDFGIARMSNMTGGYSTETGSFRGKLSYAAPERFGKSEMTAETDIYSVGVMLHELLTGRNEFFTGDHASTIARVLNHNVSSVLGKRPDAPPGVDRIIAKSLSKEWELRYGSAMEFANDLRRMLIQNESLVREKIAAQVKEDFDDAMASFLGCVSLAELEQAWRYPSTLPLADYRLQAADEDTINLKTEDTAEKSSPRHRITDVYRNRYKTTLPPDTHDHSMRIAVMQRGEANGTVPNTATSNRTEVVLRARPMVIVSVLLVAVLIIGGTIAWLMTRNPHPPDKFYLVQGNGTPSTLSDSAGTATASVGDTPEVDLSANNTAILNADATAAEADTSLPPVSPPQKKRESKSSKAPVKLSEDEQLMMLSSVFQKEQRSIERCLANNETALTNIDRIFVRFSVGANGVVSKTSVVPARLAGTSLAACIERIAKGTKFPAMNTPLSFAIPIAVTRSTR